MRFMSIFRLTAGAACAGSIALSIAPAAMAGPLSPPQAAGVATSDLSAVRTVSEDHERRARTYRHSDDVEVDAPTTYVRKRDRNVDVEAPFTSVERSNSGVRVRAPFVDLWVPRR